MFITRNILPQTFKAAKYANIRSLTTSPSASEDALSYCANLVKLHDYENFLATLLMTKALRSPTLVVRAFNVEIAKIQDQTTDPQIAMMRMQFWQDTLKDIYKKDQSLNKIPANPVAQELFKVCNAYKIPKRNLQKLIESRQKLMRAKYFVSLADLEKYTDDSVSAVYYSVLSVAGVQNMQADHAASHLGKAQGLTNMLSKIPYRRYTYSTSYLQQSFETNVTFLTLGIRVFLPSNYCCRYDVESIPMSSHFRMVYLPMDLLMKHNVTQEAVLRCEDSEDMRNCAYEVAISANNHLKKARSIEVPRIANQIFLPAIAIDRYLKNLQKRNFNVFDNSLIHRSVTLPLNYYFMRMLNKY